MDLTHMEGAFLYRPDGTYAQMLEHFKDNQYASEDMKSRKWDDSSGYYPANSIPEDAPLVVTPQAIAEFVAKVSGALIEKPLDERERASLLCIIGALADHSNLDLSQPYKAGQAVAAMLPGNVKLSARSIGDHLKNVPEAMDSRTT